MKTPLVVTLADKSLSGKGALAGDVLILALRLLEMVLPVSRYPRMIPSKTLAVPACDM